MPYFDLFGQNDHEVLGALHVVSLIEASGHEAWLVGGCVRDALLNRSISDIDITTNTPAQEVETIMSRAGLASHRTGLAYGTITVCVPSDSVDPHADAEAPLFTYEVTTYRTDGAYRDARHPESVSFCETVEEDLSRRDFTMNAIAWHPERGIVDPFEGASDIAAGIIRTVGEPLERFSEDALRILRACRFESQLGFTIEERTFRAMLEKKHRLPRLPRERILKELDAFVLGDHVRRALLDCVDVIAPIIPEIAAIKDFPQHTPYHCYDVLEHTAYAMEMIGSQRLLRWAALLHDIGKPAAHFKREDGISHFFGHARIGAQLVADICKRLGFPKSLSEDLVALVAMHDDRLEPSPRAIKRMLQRLGGDESLFYALCALKRADSLAHAPEYRQRAVSAQEAIRVFEEMKERDDAWRIADLAINGDDLLALGFAEGPGIGQTLNEALECVIDERIENDRASLLTWAKARIT